MNMRMPSRELLPASCRDANIVILGYRPLVKQLSHAI